MNCKTLNSWSWKRWRKPETRSPNAAGFFWHREQYRLFQLFPSSSWVPFFIAILKQSAESLFQLYSWKKKALFCHYCSMHQNVNKQFAEANILRVEKLNLRCGRSGTKVCVHNFCCISVINDHKQQHKQQQFITVNTASTLILPCNSSIST